MDSFNQPQINKKQKAGKLRRLFSFLAGNWIVVLILLMFASQIYVAIQIKKLANPAGFANRSAEENVGSNLNQMKSMMSSLFSRIGTMQGDLNYLKSRR